MDASDEQFMRIALEQAQCAGDSGEVPVGAVVVLDGRVLARAANRTITDGDPTAHAEIVALRAAAKALGNYRLSSATLYVTLEPCAMCAGALVHARVARLVYGCEDSKVGAANWCMRVLDHPMLNHRVEVTAGILADESAALLREFFEAKR